MHGMLGCAVSSHGIHGIHRRLGCAVSSHGIHGMHRRLECVVSSHGMHGMLGGAAVSAAPTEQRCTAHRTHLGGYGIPAIPTPPAVIVFSHRWHRCTQMFRLRSIVPRNTQNTQKFSSARKFCEFCGSTFQQEASVCSVNSVGRCSGSLVGALLAWLVQLRQLHPLGGCVWQP